MKNMITYVPFVDHEHLAGHSLIAFVTARTMLKKTLAHLFDSHPVRVGSIGTRLQLAFYVNTEGIGGLLAQKMLATPAATTVGIIHEPCGFGFAQFGLPRTLANFGHGQSVIFFGLL